jgi:retinol dehydrogenase-12
LLAVEATGFKNAELALVDLAEFTSVSAFANTFIRDNAQIDILVYNAAVLLHHYSTSKNGYDVFLIIFKSRDRTRFSGFR